MHTTVSPGRQFCRGPHKASSCIPSHKPCMPALVDVLQGLPVCASREQERAHAHREIHTRILADVPGTVIGDFIHVEP